MEHLKTIMITHWCQDRLAHAALRMAARHLASQHCRIVHLSFLQPPHHAALISYSPLLITSPHTSINTHNISLWLSSMQVPWEIQIDCVRRAHTGTRAHTLTNNQATANRDGQSLCDLPGFSRSLVVLPLPGAWGFDLIKGFVSWGNRRRVGGRSEEARCGETKWREGKEDERR